MPDRAADQHATHAEVSAAGDAPLGGLAAAAFLARFWQKEALLVSNALPGAGDLFNARQLLALAEHDGVESRLVMRRGKRWTLAHGPFKRRDLKVLPARDWTLLIQGVNLHARAADDLLRRFSFLPYARLDDVMLSYAAPGGGVGPHFDSYDVFLVQGFGRRRWRYGRQDDLSLEPGLPLKILKRFAPRDDQVLGPGDMLYLPPHFAHDGVALDACSTYSIGFRAASANEAGAAFLDFLRDGLDLPGRYADPDCAPAHHPAQIGSDMQKQYTRMLRGIRWNTSVVNRFVGCWLSEPKPSVFFDRPAARLTRARFMRKAAQRGLRLDARTQLLYDRHHLFVNGSALPWPADGADLLRRLADRRALSTREVAALPATIGTLIHDWYCNGFLHTDDTA